MKHASAHHRHSSDVWGDNIVKNMSSLRLAAILRHRQDMSEMEYLLSSAARQELIKRGHYENSIRWKMV